MFWRCLHDSGQFIFAVRNGLSDNRLGLTSKLLRPQNGIDMPSTHNFGLTDLVQRPTSGEANLTLQEKLESVQSLLERKFVYPILHVPLFIDRFSTESHVIAHESLPWCPSVFGTVYYGDCMTQSMGDGRPYTGSAYCPHPPIGLGKSRSRARSQVERGVAEGLRGGSSCILVRRRLLPGHPLTGLQDTTDGISETLIIALPSPSGRNGIPVSV